MPPDKIVGTASCDDASPILHGLAFTTGAVVAHQFGISGANAAEVRSYGTSHETYILVNWIASTGQSGQVILRQSRALSVRHYRPLIVRKGKISVHEAMSQGVPFGAAAAFGLQPKSNIRW
jgi:hypothetical protein